MQLEGDTFFLFKLADFDGEEKGAGSSVTLLTTVLFLKLNPED